MFTCSSYGPTFGTEDLDLYISTNAASNSYSYTYCGYHYPLPPGYSASGYSGRFYAGGSSIYFIPGAPNENIVQNHLNIALLNVI